MIKEWQLSHFGTPQAVTKTFSWLFMPTLILFTARIIKKKMVSRVPPTLP